MVKFLQRRAAATTSKQPQAVTAVSTKAHYHYRPLLPSGKPADLPWLVRLFYLNVAWPLSDEATPRMRLINKLGMIAGFLIFSVINEAELFFVVEYRHDIGTALEGMATYLILIELHCRIYSMAFNQKHFKQLIKQFYLAIYVEQEREPQVFQRINRNLLPTTISTSVYIVTLFTYLAIPIIGFCTNRRLLPFKMLFHYDHTETLFIYLPTLIVTLFIGFAVVSHLVAEGNIMALLIQHLNARYRLLQEDLLALDAEPTDTESIVQVYKRKLIEIIRRNAVLNDFSINLQAQYSFRIFVILALSAVLLCVLGFEVVTLGASSKNATYVTWIFSKTVELIIFGELGSTLVHTTDKMSTSYYLAKWEDIILKSTNTRENIELMKIITMAINLNRKPFYLTGLNFFSVSLETAVSILQGAGSYFTCLYAFR